MKTVDITELLSKNRIAAKAKLKRQGLYLPRRPVFARPKLPSNLTDLDDAQLMALFVRFTRYQDHVHGLVATAEIDEHAVETMLEIAKARYLAKSWTGSSSDRIAVAKAEATLDVQVRDYDDQFASCKALRKMYVVLFDSLTRDASVVSREISRRIGRSDGERRSDRYTP